MRIGIFGGTFDPPHIGHIRSAQAAISQLGLDLLYIIPTGTPPHKSLSDNSASNEMRLKMTCIAAEDVEKAVVSGIETLRPGKSYTVDTLAELEKRHPKADMFLLMGTDMFMSVETWHKYEEVLHSVTLAVFARNDNDEGRIAVHAEHILSEYGTKTEIIKHDTVSISSSELREKLRNREGKEYLSENIYTVIIKNSLYGAKPDFDWLRSKAYAKLDAKRVPHVAGCEKEAVRLARRWGENEDDAREAAILHDITKNLNLSQQLLLCDKYGIIIDYMERKDSKLLHSKTGAALAKNEFAASDIIHDAIYWHTTGKEDMSLLEKIIYMADYIEPTRGFDGVEKLRELAYKDLDEAIYLGFEMSIEDMKNRGIVPHENTKNAMEWIRKYIGAN